MTQFTRREWMRAGTAIALTLSHRPSSLMGFDTPGEEDELIPFRPGQPRNPNRPMVHWESLTEWHTPVDDVYVVSHYGNPELDADQYQLEIQGLVKHPLKLSLKDIQSRPRRSVTTTLECGGNGASMAFMGAVANQTWTGTPLLPILQEAGLLEEGIEVVFWGADTKEEEIRKKKFKVHFGRSLSREDALREDLTLAYELDGKPLPFNHGFPVRLVVPGWYGIAWVKWLTRIEVMDRRFMGRFMGRDYVTIRGEERDGEVVYKETSVTRMNLKSMTAKVLRKSDGRVLIQGAAWSDGTPLRSVEIRIDDGPWVPAQILPQKEKNPFAWSFWQFEWKEAQPGEHRIVSRAIDAKGNIQPTPEDPSIALKETYWEANQQVERKIQIP